MLEALVDHWYEGSGVRNLIIRNNRFDKCNCADWSSVIDIFAILPNEKSKYPIFKNIKIDGNKLSNYPSIAMYISTADQVQLQNNILKNSKSGQKQIIAERCGIISNANDFCQWQPFK